VVHKEVVSQDSHRETILDEGLLTPPIVLKHEWDFGGIAGDMHGLVVRGGVCISTHATDAHDLLDLRALRA